MKNYLAISGHKKRGFSFFLAANREYRKYMQSLVLDAFYLHAFKRKEALQKFHKNRLNRLFVTFNKTILKLKAARIFKEER